MNESLLIFTEHLPAPPRSPPRAAPTDGALKLVLPFEQREKTRQRARLTAGYEIGIQLPRGTVLRGGDRLRAANGTIVEIVAAREAVSTIWSRDMRQLARAAYHLGNRHVALEVGTGWVRYRTDHVLDAMVIQLGLAVQHEREPFEPEAGAYGAHTHTHGQAERLAPFLPAPSHAPTAAATSGGEHAARTPATRSGLRLVLHEP